MLSQECSRPPNAQRTGGRRATTQARGRLFFLSAEDVGVELQASPQGLKRKATWSESGPGPRQLRLEESVESLEKSRADTEGNWGPGQCGAWGRWLGCGSRAMLTGNGGTWG